MDAPQAPSAFDLEALSVREREVLDLATEGRSDAEIAQALGLSVSTVNSYWVRIRGKLGPLSRIELVSQLLRHESGHRHADLIAENERLRASERAAQAGLAQSQSHLRATEGSWPLLALAHSPDATLVCVPPDRVVYANLQAQRLFATEPGELEGTLAWDLATNESAVLWREEAERLFEDAGPQRAVLGIETPVYCQRRDGENFRAVILAERFVAAEGPMVVKVVREYLGEAEAILKALRQPSRVR